MYWVRDEKELNFSVYKSVVLYTCRKKYVYLRLEGFILFVMAQLKKYRQLLLRFEPKISKLKCPMG